MTSLPAPMLKKGDVVRKGNEGPVMTIEGDPFLFDERPACTCLWYATGFGYRRDVFFLADLELHVPFKPRVVS